MELCNRDKVALVGCSNPLRSISREEMESLMDVLRQMGLVPVISDDIYEDENTGAENRAKQLMDFYRDDEIRVIFDVSGGDMANEVLPYLDYEVIRNSDKIFWGYSDLTTVLNAIYAKTGKASVLYQVRNLTGRNGGMQQEDFYSSMLEGTSQLFAAEYEFVQGDSVCGTVVGGNIRCLLKLAGTAYWPDMNGKILFLESRSGKVPQMLTFLSQLSQLGVFEQIQGVVLGTFTQMEKEQCVPEMAELVRRYAGDEMPVIRTRQIGHGSDSKALVIGEMYCFQKR